MNICVYGAVRTDIDNVYINLAEELGRKIAVRNHNLVFGGMKDGILGAVARGIRENTNLDIIGIMPEFFLEDRKDSIYDECTEKIFTKTIDDRKIKFKELSDAVIIAPGGVGTYDEFFDILNSKRMNAHNKPIVIYNMNNYYDKLQDFIEYTIQNNFAWPDLTLSYVIFNTADEVLDYIENYIGDKICQK